MAWLLAGIAIWYVFRNIAKQQELQKEIDFQKQQERYRKDLENMTHTVRTWKK